jgi:hypothetical protein
VQQVQRGTKVNAIREQLHNKKKIKKIKIQCVLALRINSFNHA